MFTLKPTQIGNSVRLVLPKKAYRNHPFIDGNKQATFLEAGMFYV